ncbi:hypothetical protein CP970_36685 [Streptomyces kanamyceticus]|uniref:Carrier domain-containing protein n=1 Tax=Streptomyces kanamyceticus TaxID=1967 RepID=A0A5J6GPR6_STRKN|nr:phosphopantetheine-binding protein [Streptomyces kanamyceticus]QEU95738.1 hypothetical protein CP970_36685 [Streptomyces kanamyceticus]
MTEGMNATDTRVLASNGLLPMSSEQGLALFDAALGLQVPLAVPTPIGLDALRTRLANGDPMSPLLKALVTVRARRRVSAATGDGTSGGAPVTGQADDGSVLVKELTAADEEQRLPMVLDVVRKYAAAILGLADGGAVPANRGLLDLGFDSLTAVELRNRLGRAAGLRLPTTLVFDHPTAQGVASYILSRLDLGGGPQGDAMGSVFADVDRLTATLAAAPPDVRTRGELAARLQSVLLMLGESDVTEQIKEATDDEMFAFIDNELGS